MKKQLIKSIVAFLGLNLFFIFSAFSQSESITVRVNDIDGNPISGAIVSIGEGNQVQTNEKGEFTINVKTRTSILIEAEGFESIISYAMPPPTGMGNVTLIKMPYLMGEKDQVNIPFGTLKNRQMTSAFSVFDPDQILAYDQQKSFGGIINGRVPGMYGGNNIRGKNNPLVIVDGVPTYFGNLNPQQIDQITVLKDLSAGMLYGSQAINGVILIKTKRGEPLKRTLRATAENSFNFPGTFPKYLNSADYMSYYNEALINDGLNPLYGPDTISNTANGINPVFYPDQDYYNSTFLKDWYTSQNLVLEAGGGNEVSQYYLNLGWNRDNSLLKLGEGNNEKMDNFNMRGNVDYELSDHIKVKLDGAFYLSLDKGPRYSGADFWNLAGTLRPNYSPLLIPVSMVEDSALLEGAKLYDGQYLLGGSSEFQTNMYGEMLRNGNRKSLSRLLQMNTGIDFDLDFITPGLTASSYITFDIFNSFNDNLMHTYAVYSPVFTSDSVISTAALIGKDERVDNRTVNNVFFYNSVGMYGTLDYKRVFNSIHDVTVNSVIYRDQLRYEGELQARKHLHMGIRANYSFNQKYITELTGVVAGSSRLFESSRYAFSPGIGVAWVVSEEGFLSDNSFIDFLKIRANYAMNHSDENIEHYLYLSNYYEGGGNWQYNNGGQGNSPRTSFSGNPNLGWEKTTEYNVGFESVLMGGLVNLQGSYFYSKASDLISTRINYFPVYFSTSIYDNFGAEQYQGVELGLNLSQTFGDFSFNLGTNFVYSVPKTLLIDEPVYSDDLSYLTRAGKPTDAMFGWVSDGLFQSQEDIDTSSFQTFGLVRPGDIKYKDLNGDRVIDNNDREVIGNSRSRFGYGLNLNLKYKRLELFANGTGQTGGHSYYNNAYYWVYGSRKYSEVVLDRWTEETAATATYPRLSTTNSSNNFRNSTFWIQNRDYFRLQTVQLTYTFPANMGILKETRIFVRGNNLATISKIKDKLDLNIGSMPRMRQFSFGLTAAF
jgi:TonB-linked SusC/RagA family outer membrane protein